MPSDLPNDTQTRDLWLRHATDALRPLFETHGLPLPAEIRFAIAFTSSGRKGKRVGETWHDGATADRAFEIFLRADLAAPIDVLTVLVRQLVHAALPATDSHGKLYKAAANKIGLSGKMREAVPNPYLLERLERLVTELPPLPHAALNLDWKAMDKPRKQGTRMLKAECAKRLMKTTHVAIRFACRRNGRRWVRFARSMALWTWKSRNRMRLRQLKSSNRPS